jgi:hypothetical protein
MDNPLRIQNKIITKYLRILLNNNEYESMYTFVRKILDDHGTHVSILHNAFIMTRNVDNIDINEIREELVILIDSKL